jgi:hypothetical protein
VSTRKEKRHGWQIRANTFVVVNCYKGLSRADIISAFLAGHTATDRANPTTAGEELSRTLDRSASEAGVFVSAERHRADKAIENIVHLLQAA